MEGKLDEIIAKGNIELRNELVKMGNQQAADAIMLGMQAQMQKYMEQQPQQVIIAKTLEKVLSDAKMEGKLDEIIAKDNRQQFRHKENNSNNR